MRVLICGAGIGGLTAALALHARGISCQVFEAVQDIRPLGVGINLLPHAVRILSELGLDDELSVSGLRTAELAYFNKQGKLIWSEPRGREAGYEWPQYSIHRGRLQLILLQAVRRRLGDSAVRTGMHVSSFAQDPSSVTAHFTGGRTGAPAGSDTGDALIGADGIHSVIRRAFYRHEGEPVFSGRMLWRATTIAKPFLTGRTMIMAGNADRKFVAYPICPDADARGESLVNWIAELHLGTGAARPERDWNRRVDKGVFAPAFEGWRFDWLDVPALIAGADEVYEFPMIDRDPVARWSFGRVTLLGDAAHPMYPIGSNGASQAILDAEALAASLTSSGDIAAGLHAYEDCRLRATASVVESNRRMGPEAVMQIVEERAPDGFSKVEDVISREELESTSAVTSNPANGGHSKTGQ